MAGQSQQVFNSYNTPGYVKRYKQDSGTQLSEFDNTTKSKSQLLDEEKLKNDLVNQKVIIDSILEKYKTNDSGENFQEKRNKLAESLAKDRLLVQDEKNKNDKQIQNRKAIDSVIEGVGSIVAGAIGNATGQSIGDKFKYKNYDPTMDSTNAAFLAKQNDDILTTKYGTAAKESQDLQDNELKAMTATVKANQALSEAGRKISGKISDTEQKGGSRQESTGTSTGETLSSDDGKSGSSGSNKEKFTFSKLSPADESLNTRAFESAQAAISLAGDDDNQQLESVLKAFDNNARNGFRGNVAEIKKKFPDITTPKIIEMLQNPGNYVDELGQDLATKIWVTRGGDPMVSSSSGQLINKSTPPQLSIDATAIPEEQPKQKPRKGLDKFKNGPSSEKPVAFANYFDGAKPIKRFTVNKNPVEVKTTPNKDGLYEVTANNITKLVSKKQVEVLLNSEDKPGAQK